MTPWLRSPSIFRALRAAVLPPVLATTAVLGAYGIQPAYGIPPGSRAYGIRLASDASQPRYDDQPRYDGQPRPAARTADAVAQQPYVTRFAYAAHPSVPSSTRPWHSARHKTPDTDPHNPSEHTTPDRDHPRGPLRGRLAASPCSTSPSPDPSRAGSPAGEGRVRPGRPDSEPEDESDEPDEPTYTDHDPTTSPGDTPAPENPDTAAPVTDPDTATSAGAADPVEDSPAPSQDSRVPAQQAAASQPMLEILPLGSGLILIGLGLALGLLALRLRND